ncbi:MAG: dTDP-4-dehydrorhamnose 3,5-epimerase family protein [Phycisphaerales bacterium]|nr:MAG: dTDP-4-dehydrorhamnose 3,5-epimerase family protein [Phycisphaerales bacterium]
MTKEVVPLKAAFADDGLIIRSSGEVIDGVAVRRARVICDERGRLGEIMRADDPWFEKFGQAYFTTTYPGVVKAWHYHTRQTDHFYILRGTVKVGLYDERKDSPTSGTVNEIYLSEHSPGLLRIPPGVLHGWMCVGQTEAYVVNTVSEMYNYDDPDEFRVDPHDTNIPYDWTRKDG